MATYKVIQDIEAEDHILGPLSLRQFIFAIIAVVCFYFCYLVSSKGAAFLCVIFLPPGLFAGFFAFPFGKDQPTEIWALAKIRFLFKPRKRIWDQSGVKELVTVTAPKKVEEQRTDGLSQTEVRSRLSALANTIDSRGWAIKNVNVNMYSQPGVLPTGANSDRLIDVSNMAREVPSFDVQASDDIMDEQNNPIAQQFDKLINASAQTHRQQIVNMLNQPTLPQPPQAAPAATQQQGQPAANYWFLNQPVATPKLANNQAIFAAPQVITPGGDDSQLPVARSAEPTAEEEALAEHIKEEHSHPEVTYSNLKTILPLSQQPKQPPAPAATVPAAPPQPNPALMQLAGNNDLNISTIAREANKDDRNQADDGEVVIALH